jgi:hypothetical protein
MQGIITKSGFCIDEYTERGIRYITTKEQLMEKFSYIIMYLDKKDSD